MPIKRLKRWWLSIAVLVLAAGCFQPAGAGLEATSLAQALPTFTPIPSLTPTDTETPIPVATETPTIDFLTPATELPVGTLVADAALQEIEPIWQTATAIYLEQIGGQPIEIPTTAQEIDPLLLTATALVREATLTAEYPLTLTAGQIFFPTATWTQPAPPTANPGQPILPGNDCVHQVQVNDVNLYRISLLYGIHYLDIAYYPPNSILNPNLIYIGQKLVIPGCGVTGHIPPPTWTEVINPTANYPTQSYPTYTGGGNYPTYTGQPFNYVVRPGDTLFRLSLTYGVPIATILAKNPQITNLNLIYVGDTLVIG